MLRAVISINFYIGDFFSSQVAAMLSVHQKVQRVFVGHLMSFTALLQDQNFVHPTAAFFQVQFYDESLCCTNHPLGFLV